MKEVMTLVEFECRGHRFALPLASVRRVLPSAQPIPLPGVSEAVAGILNLGGEVAVILDFQQKMGLESHPIDLSQQLLLVDCADLFIGFIVDRVSGVVTHDIKNISAVSEKMASAEFARTVIRLDDGLCIICDPEKFLFDDEKMLISDALEQACHAKQ
jgi:purine-binding chemotaxis protein CheW